MTLVLNADIVLNADNAFDASKMRRRRRVSIGFDASERFWLASPEDVVLAKLRWGRQSQSEKQWRDVLGVLKVQGETLDFAYLREWADLLDLRGMLERAFVEAGLG